MNRDINVENLFIASEFTREREYWTDKLSGSWEKSIFPSDYGKKVDSERKMGIVNFRFPQELFLRVTRAMNQADPRLHAILTAGLVQIINKYTGNEDIIIGTPIDKQETEGDFINTFLVLRNRLIPGMTFKDLLFQVMQTILEACENQNYPLETLPYELNRQVDEREDFPLFDVALLLENIHEKRYISGINLNMIFSFLRTEEYIEGEVAYNTSLYAPESIERITHHYIHLLKKALNNVETPVADIDIMDEKEKNHLLFEMNRTGVEFPDSSCIHELFEYQAKKTPDNIAIEEVDTGRLITYRDLNRQANRLARLLREKGGMSGAAAAIMGERRIDTLVGILAILKAGCVFLPLDAQNPDERIRFILKDSNASFFLTQKHIITERPVISRTIIPGDCIAVDDEEIYREDQSNLSSGRRAIDIAYIIYTSGSTGRPKGVMVEHKSLVNYICWAVKQYVGNETMNFPLYSSISFDLTLTSIFTPLVTGNTVVVYGGWGKGNLVERIVDDNKVGIIKMTPSLLNLIREKKMGKKGAVVKRLIVGGENLEYQLAQSVSDNFNGNIDIYNEYGPTEAAVGCMLYKFDPKNDISKGNSVSIGVPAANVQIYLLDKNGQPVPIGAMGEIYIGGDCLARGYLNRPQLTAEKFKRDVISKKSLVNSHWSLVKNKLPKITNDHSNKLFTNDQCPMTNDRFYRTGDLARWLPGGNIEFLGRIDHQLKIRGFRIELGEIEGRLMKHPGIKDVVVTAYSAIRDSKQKEDKFLCAYFTSDKELAGPELKEYLSVTLPDYMVPLFFIKLESIPLNSNGKVDRNALPQPEMKIEEDYIAPGNRMEERLTYIWSDLLGVEKNIISMNSNFFEMGGHSLNATILVTKIHKEFNVKVSLSDVFRMATVKSLAMHLNTAAEKKFTPIEVMEEREYYELSSAQKRLYILQHLHSENIGYNIPAVLQLEGKPDEEKMKDTFARLVKRHENFRTAFLLVNDEPVQRIYEEVDFRVDYYETPVEADVKKIVKDFIRPFFLDKVPLLRVGLIKMNENRRILMLDMHHIISDGVSMNVFVNEYMALYGGDNLPDLKLQYKDYSQWQNSKQERASLKKQEEYWLKRFEGAIPVINLPTDYVRPTEQSFEGSSVNFEIGIERTAELKKLVLETGVTLYIFMLAVYNILLSKISGQKDIIVGAPVAGRKHADIQQIIGVFVNILAFRNYADEKETFLDFLEEVKRNSLDAFDNQEYQFEELVDKLALKRYAGRSPLFDAAFMLESDENQGGDIREMRTRGLKLKSYGQGRQVAKYDLFFYVYEGNNIRMKLQYCTKLFKPETINILKGYVIKIIDVVLGNPRVKLSRIDIGTQDKDRKVRYQFVDDLENESI